MPWTVPQVVLMSDLPVVPLVPLVLKRKLLDPGQL